MTARKHFLKTWPLAFAAVRAGAKPFEVRWNDRDFLVGDLLELAEFDPVKGVFSGETEVRRVTFVLSGPDAEQFGVMPGYVVMGMETLPLDVAFTADALTLTPAQLNAWHAEHSRNAILRADNYRRVAEQTGRLPNCTVAVGRHRACEAHARLEAGFHAQAALIVAGGRDA
jgi:hypothetical protein